MSLAYTLQVASVIVIFSYPGTSTVAQNEVKIASKKSSIKNNGARLAPVQHTWMVWDFSFISAQQRQATAEQNWRR